MLKERIESHNPSIDEPNLRWLKNPTLVDGDQHYTQYWDPATSTWKNI